MDIWNLYLEIKKIIGSSLLEQESANITLHGEDIFYDIFYQDIEMCSGLIGLDSGMDMKVAPPRMENPTVMISRANEYDKIMNKADLFYKNNYNMDEVKKKEFKLDRIFSNKVYGVNTYKKVLEKYLESIYYQKNPLNMDRFNSTYVIRHEYLMVAENFLKTFLVDNLVACVHNYFSENTDKFKSVFKEKYFYTVSGIGCDVIVTFVCGKCHCEYTVTFDFEDDEFKTNKSQEECKCFDKIFSDFIEEVRPELNKARNCVIYDENYLDSNRLIDIVDCILELNLNK